MAFHCCEDGDGCPNVEAVILLFPNKPLLVVVVVEDDDAAVVVVVEVDVLVEALLFPPKKVVVPHVTILSFYLRMMYHSNIIVSDETAVTVQ